MLVQTSSVCLGLGCLLWHGRLLHAQCFAAASNPAQPEQLCDRAKSSQTAGMASKSNGCVPMAAAAPLQSPDYALAPTPVFNAPDAATAAAAALLLR